MAQYLYPDASRIGDSTRFGQGDLYPLHPLVGQYQHGDLLGHGFDQLHYLALGVITDLAGEGGVIQCQIDIVGCGGGSVVEPHLEIETELLANALLHSYTPMVVKTSSPRINTLSMTVLLLYS